MLVLVVAFIVVTVYGAEEKLSATSEATINRVSAFPNPMDILQGMRVKRGYGQSHGHGPGRGGGASGPVYICGYIGSKEGCEFIYFILKDRDFKTFEFFLDGGYGR
jgi:hypothetical protein